MFTENVIGLSPDTGYSFVAYATNSGGTSYRSPVSDIHASVGRRRPTVTTPTVSSLTAISATLGGDVTSSGSGNHLQARRVVCR